MPQINDTIRWTRMNNHATRAARTFLQSINDLIEEKRTLLQSTIWLAERGKLIVLHLQHALHYDPWFNCLNVETIILLHVRNESKYSSLKQTTKRQRKISKFEILVTAQARSSKCLIPCLETKIFRYNQVRGHCAQFVSRGQHGIRYRSKPTTKFYLEVTLSLGQPSWLLKLRSMFFFYSSMVLRHHSAEAFFESSIACCKLSFASSNVGSIFIASVRSLIASRYLPIL